jgi:hypothetical protein
LVLLILLVLRLRGTAVAVINVVVADIVADTGVCCSEEDAKKDDLETPSNHRHHRQDHEFSCCTAAARLQHTALWDLVLSSEHDLLLVGACCFSLSSHTLSLYMHYSRNAVTLRIHCRARLNQNNG